MQNFLTLLASAQQAVHVAEQKLQELQAVDVAGETEKVKKLLAGYSKVEKAIREEKKNILAGLLELAVIGGIKDCYLPIGTCYTYTILTTEKVSVSVDNQHKRFIQPEDREVMKTFDLQGFVDCRRLWFFEFCRDIVHQIERLFEAKPRQQAIQMDMLKNLKAKLIELAKKES